LEVGCDFGESVGRGVCGHRLGEGFAEKRLRGRKDQLVLYLLEIYDGVVSWW
jgi:hypothetical protein